MRDYVNSFHTEFLEQRDKTSGVYTKKDFLETFCRVVLETGIYQHSEQMVYNPKQSLFLSTICVNIDKSFRQSFDSRYVEEQIIKKDKGDRERIGFLDSVRLRNRCNPKSDMKNCPFDKLFPGLFDTLMNDYSNIRLANVYGVTQVDDGSASTKKKMARQLVNEYFGRKRNEDKKEREPINKEFEFCGEPCRYPKTENLLFKFFKNAYKLAKNTQMVDFDQVIETAIKGESGLCPDVPIQQNMIYCGLMSSRG